MHEHKSFVPNRGHSNFVFKITAFHRPGEFGFDDKCTTMFQISRVTEKLNGVAATVAEVSLDAGDVTGHCFVSGLPAIIPPGLWFRSNLAHGSLQKKLYLTGHLHIKNNQVSASAETIGDMNKSIVEALDKAGVPDANIWKRSRRAKLLKLARGK